MHICPMHLQSLPATPSLKIRHCMGIVQGVFKGRGLTVWADWTFPSSTGQTEAACNLILTENEITITFHSPIFTSIVAASLHHTLNLWSPIVGKTTPLQYLNNSTLLYCS